jgi:hypothetical protein
MVLGPGPEAAEASTAAPSHRIGGTRFLVNERVAKKPRLSGASVAFEADTPYRAGSDNYDGQPADEWCELGLDSR